MINTHFYKDPSIFPAPGSVYGYDSEEEFAEYGQPGLVPMTQKEVDDHLNPPEEAVVPERVTMRQAKEALILAGLDDDIEIALNAIQDPIQKKIALCQWRESNEMHRNMPLVQQIGAALGLSEQAIDDLFVEAAKR